MQILQGPAGLLLVKTRVSSWICQNIAQYAFVFYYLWIFISVISSRSMSWDWGMCSVQLKKQIPSGDDECISLRVFTVPRVLWIFSSLGVLNQVCTQHWTINFFFVGYNSNGDIEKKLIRIQDSLST